MGRFADRVRADLLVASCAQPFVSALVESDFQGWPSGGSERHHFWGSIMFKNMADAGRPKSSASRWLRSLDGDNQIQSLLNERDGRGRTEWTPSPAKFGAAAALLFGCGGL
jgi:hypothetical protein